MRALEREVVDAVYAIIIGSAGWPPEDWDWGYDPCSGKFDWHAVEPEWAVGFRRWVWSGSKLLQIKSFPHDS